MHNDKIVLQFKDDLSVKMKNNLHARGFTQYARKVGEWVMFYKDKDSAKEGMDCLTISQCLEAILSSYHDVYGQIGAIRAECVDFAKSLPAEKKAWAFEWIEENIDNEFKTVPPWEDEDWQPNLGFC